MSNRSESPTVQAWRRKRQSKERTVTNLITRFSGSMSFVVIHAVWFSVWILANLEFAKPFDPFPFGLLTLIVSLEAIFLSTFVLITQNSQSAESDRKELEDLKTNIRSEVIAELIAEHVGIKEDDIRRRYDENLLKAQN